jgi:hypothetical protein
LAEPPVLLSFVAFFNGLKSVVTISAEAMPLFCWVSYLPNMS